MSSNVSSYALEKTETLFRTKIEETGDWIVWNVRRFRVEETLGQPYSGVVEIVTRDLEAEVISLAGADCVLEIDRGPERIRRFGGIVTKITNIGDQQEKDLAQVHFAPALSALDFGTNSRSFEEMTTAQIVETVLIEGLKEFYRPFKMSLKNEQAQKTYCIQHEESDLAFITRLMADEGMFYFFEQQEHQEVVVVVDANESCPEQDTMGYDGDVESEEQEPKYDNSFSTMGQTYTDVTPKPPVSFKNAKIKFISPKDEFGKISVTLKNKSKNCILKVSVEDAPEAQNITWKIDAIGKINDGRSGVQTQEGKLFTFERNPDAKSNYDFIDSPHKAFFLKCESKIENESSSITLFHGMTNGMQFVVEASLEGAKPARCFIELEVDPKIQEIKDEKYIKFTEIVSKLPAGVHRKNGKIYICYIKVDHAEETLRKAVISYIKNLLSKFDDVVYVENMEPISSDNVEKYTKEYGNFTYLNVVLTNQIFEPAKMNVHVHLKNINDWVLIGRFKLIESSSPEEREIGVQNSIEEAFAEIHKEFATKYPGTM